MVNVALSKGFVRYDNVYSSLKLIEADVAIKLEDAKRIVIKPDLLHTNGEPCSDVDSAKAVLDFLQEHTNKTITIAEGAFVGDDVFSSSQFTRLLADYSVKFVNLNHDDAVPVTIGKSQVSISQLMLKSDFRVSLASLHSDSSFSIMGAIPNIILGSIAESGKSDFYKNRLSARKFPELLKLLSPALSVIDCFEASKFSKSIVYGSSIASKDAVAADFVAAKILNVKPNYLALCAPSAVKIVGSKISELSG